MAMEEKKQSNKELPSPFDAEEEELGASMTFLEHLVELRMRMIRVLIAFGTAFVLCFMFAQDLTAILIDCVPKSAEKNTLEEFLEAQKQQTTEFQTVKSATGTVNSATGTVNSATGTVSTPSSATDTYSTPKNTTPALTKEESALYTTIDRIVEAKMGAFTKDGSATIIAKNPVEVLITWIKVSFVAGLFLAFPFIFYQVWMFVAPGLYKREKRLVLPLVIAAWICFVAGGLFCYFVVFRFILSFLAMLAAGTAANLWTISEYLNFMLRFLLAFALVFEEPVVIFLLAKIGMVTKAALLKFSPYAIVLMFVVSALITPPDPFSQMICAGPLIALYFGSVLLVGFIEKKQANEEDDASFA